jgi:hypothetical protein
MIKRYLLLLLVPFVFGPFIYGQNTEFKPEWNVGAGFGPTFSSVDFQSNPSANNVRKARIATKNSMRYHGGIAIRYISEKNIGIIAELNYSQQGWEQDFSKNDNYKDMGLEHSHKLNYLELPILTHIYFGNKVRFFFNIGPKISYLTSDSEKMNTALEEFLAGGVDDSFETNQYFRKADRKIDYGLMGGMGLEIRTGIGGFALEGRYSFGLGDIYKSSKSDYFARSANRVIYARLTYYVKLF